MENPVTHYYYSLFATQNTTSQLFTLFYVQKSTHRASFTSLHCLRTNKIDRNTLSFAHTDSNSGLSVAIFRHLTHTNHLHKSTVSGTIRIATRAPVEQSSLLQHYYCPINQQNALPLLTHSLVLLIHNPAQQASIAT